MGNHGLTRVRYQGDRCVIVSGPVPAHIAEGAVEQTPLEAVPGKVDKLEKPKPPKFQAKTAASAAPTPVKEGK